MSTDVNNTETELDVGAAQLGGVYAKALLGAAERSGEAPSVLAELDSLVTDVLDAYPKFETVLGSELIPPDEKVEIVDRTFGGRASPLLLNFLKVLAQHGRLNVLREIRRAAHKLHDELRGQVRVDVITAVPLDHALAHRLTEQLRGMLGAEPHLNRVTDPKLIGGVVLRVGDTIYDGSIATHLDRVRQQMINRSVHEIQSRRDRFSHSG
jgi:F-type H+-transporting ATPase subunit delta